jgi:hypothetical protein
VEWILGVVALVGLVGVRVVAARRVARGDRRFVWLLFAPTLFFAFAMIWVSVNLLSVQPVAGLFFGAVSVIGAILLARMVRAIATAPRARDEWSLTSGPAEDFLVWGALAVPLLTAVALIVLLITGGLGETR